MNVSAPPVAGPARSELHDLVALIRANTPLIVVETRDEARVVELFRQALMHVWRELYRWTITEGLRRLDFDREDPPHVAPDATNTFQAMRDAEQRGIYVLFDMATRAASACCATWCSVATASRT